MDADLDPLRDDSPEAWDHLIEQVDPASILVTVQGWLGPSIRRWHTAEDVWQETLLHAWRDRDSFEWRGPGAFRSWLLTIAKRRVLDLSDHATAAKREAARERSPTPSTSISGGSHYGGPVQETTPDRVAIDRERAEILLRALEDVPAEHRDVVRLRLFEDLTMEEIGNRLDLGVEAIRYRFRSGANSYRASLRRAQVSPSRWNPRD